VRRENYPNLTDENHRLTSPATSEYNCIAWAAGETIRSWWPSDENIGYYWPNGAPCSTTLEAFVGAFETLGYRQCNNAELEVGFEKVALYAAALGEPKHAARQLQSGRWTSKIGGMEDIEHAALSCLEGDRYGYVQRVLRRKVADANVVVSSL
jgi:hypothetical protein